MTESNKLYPNDGKSYVMSGGGASSDDRRGQPQARSSIKKAVLYAVSNMGSGTTGFDGNVYGLPNGGLGSGTSEITSPPLKKEFQFNPPTLIMSIQMAATDSSDTQQPGGNLSGNQYIGTAGSSVEMLFDRTAEVHRGIQDPNGAYGEYARLGVAKDILDVYAVLIGDPTLLEAQTDKNIRELTRGLTDLVSQGSRILMGHRAAISYSHDLVVFGLVTEMRFRFIRFNYQLIPTFGYVDLKFDVHKAGNTSSVRNEMAPGPVPSNGNRGGNTASHNPGTGSGGGGGSSGTQPTAPGADGGGSSDW